MEVVVVEVLEVLVEVVVEVLELLVEVVVEVLVPACRRGSGW